MTEYSLTYISGKYNRIANEDHDRRMKQKVVRLTIGHRKGSISIQRHRYSNDTKSFIASHYGRPIRDLTGLIQVLLFIADTRDAVKAVM